MHIILCMSIEKFMKELFDMEESLWQRRMKVLYQYKRVQEMRQKIREIEEVFEEEVGIDLQTALYFLEEYESNPQSFERIKETLGEEVFQTIEALADRIRQIRDMKKEVDEVEKEIFEIDAEIDDTFEKLQEYKRKIQEML
ncbi:hypothetical protein IAE16_07070 [Hydrogenobacter sp. T-2]|uniref:hypothetical protein n=1 Tax=Pampinifervens diazotrophicum TaxID=1632018 RepID=UPI002B25DD60|nr:hypothetical protein [Hydrogenobacter sp. T-2]WPM31579.1 hypothetical protein IAE16_07070 [Hydrogenobacter sp. T-2]